MNYDSRSTWDTGLDAGSIPARSITCGKEGPNEVGRIPYHLQTTVRRDPTKLGGFLITYTDAREDSGLSGVFFVK